MTFIVQLELSGKINRAAFDEAVNESLKRHPLMTAVIGPGKQGKDCWIAASDPVPLVDWGPPNAPADFQKSEYLNIRNEVGLRIFVRYDDERAIVTTQFHHATCDGIGSYQYIGDLLYEYAIRTGDPDLPRSVELDSKRLKERGKTSYDINNFRLPDGGYQRTWDEALRLMLMFNICLRPKKKKNSNFQRPFPGIQSHVFDKAEYKRLRLVAQANGQIINDLLLEKLFKTLHEWEHRTRSLRMRRNVCVMMPLNLREPTDNDISACNIVAHAFLRRTWAELQDTKQFRNKLANEVLQVKHDRHKIRFMHMLAGGHYFYPKTLKTSLDIKRCLATAILSNTGDPTKQFHAEFPRENGAVRCGNLLLEDISGVPPLRPGTNATISIFTYRRVLKICLRCDPNQFSESDTQELLDLYVDNVRSDSGS